MGYGDKMTIGSYTLVFSATGYISTTSNTITLSAGAASQLSYNQQPSTTASSGQPLLQEPILLLRDAANNPVSGVVVTATITGAPAGVSRIGTTTITTTASGIASFVGSGFVGRISLVIWARCRFFPIRAFPVMNSGSRSYRWETVSAM